MKSDRDEYLMKMDYLLNALDDKTRNLAVGVHTNGNNSGVKKLFLLGLMRSKQEKARKKLNRLKKSPGCSWREDRKLFQKAYLDFQDAFLSMVAQLSE